MHLISSYFIFLLKIITLVLAILAVAVGLIAIASKGKGGSKSKIRIKKRNKHYDDLKQKMDAALMPQDEFKQLLKSLKKSAKNETKKLKKDSKKDSKKQSKQNQAAATTKAKPKKRIFVIDFKGDIKASAVDELSESISAIILGASKQDEVLLRLESPGGMVHQYGLAAAELSRLRSANIPLTIAVDRVAASGGYMMACIADKIIAAPFAIIGSIGVVAQLPNFNRWLDKHNIDFEQLTAGEYKRTLTMFGENTKQGREKMQTEIDETQVLFKTFIKQYRRSVDIDQVATGEHWYAQQAIEFKLVDELKTAETYLLESAEQNDIYELSFKQKQSLMQKLTEKMSLSIVNHLSGYSLIQRIGRL